MKPEEFARKWAAEAEWMRRRNALVSGADLCEEMLVDLEAVLKPLTEEVLNLTEAAHESGYSADYLGRLLREGKIPNAGRPNAPKIRRSDLPVKASRLRPHQQSVKVVGASRGHIARSVVESEKGNPR